MEAAARWFAEQLGGVEGAAARAYLERRGISRGDPAHGSASASRPIRGASSRRR